MMNYRIVASDFDGTLLNSESEISEGNLQAIEALMDKNVHFVPASGRESAF